MKKRLRFQMPHVPLKVLRGQQDEEDVQDQLYERFQAPGTTTEEDNNGKDDDDSLRSSLCEDSEESIKGYPGWHTDSVNSANPFDDDSNEGDQNVQNNTLDYDEQESVDNAATNVQVEAAVHGSPNANVTSNDSLSNDDTTPLLAKH